MKYLLAFLLSSCSALGIGSDGTFDPIKAADTIALYEADVRDAALLVDPLTAGRLLLLAARIDAVEQHLRLAGPGEISLFVYAAMEAADLVASESPEGSNARLVAVLAKVALRHLSVREMPEEPTS